MEGSKPVRKDTPAIIPRNIQSQLIIILTLHLLDISHGILIILLYESLMFLDILQILDKNCSCLIICYAFPQITYRAPNPFNLLIK